MRLILLRHAYNRFLSLKAAEEPNLPRSRRRACPFRKDDFARKSALFLRDTSQYDVIEPDHGTVLDPETAAIRAGRLMLEEINNHVRRGESFAFESTLSGLMYARRIPRWRQAGYRVKLIYLSLPNPEMAIARVAYRVAQGGHFIPEAVIRRRFNAGWRNFNSRYKILLDAWALYDNSQRQAVLIEEGVNDEDQYSG